MLSCNKLHTVVGHSPISVTQPQIQLAAALLDGDDTADRQQLLQQIAKGIGFPRSGLSGDHNIKSISKRRPEEPKQLVAGGAVHNLIGHHRRLHETDRSRHTLRISDNWLLIGNYADIPTQPSIPLRVGFVHAATTFPKQTAEYGNAVSG